MAYLPTTEAVTVGWLKTLSGLNPLRVATSLPGDNASWADTGFVVASSVGGAPGVDTPLNRPVVQIDCWASSVNSQKPPWGKAGHLAETILLSTYSFEPVKPALPGDFEEAQVLSVYPISQPRRMFGDEAGFARYMFELAVIWRVNL